MKDETLLSEEKSEWLPVDDLTVDDLTVELRVMECPSASNVYLLIYCLLKDRETSLSPATGHSNTSEFVSSYNAHEASGAVNRSPGVHDNRS